MTYRPPHADLVEAALDHIEPDFGLAITHNLRLDYGSRKQAAALIDELYYALETAAQRECSTWCDKGLGEHTKHCRRFRYSLERARAAS